MRAKIPWHILNFPGLTPYSRGKPRDYSLKLRNIAAEFVMISVREIMILLPTEQSDLAAAPNPRLLTNRKHNWP